MAQEVEALAGPIRTCVGCRTTAQQNELLRVVLRQDQVVVDANNRLSGRGAYLHRNLQCIDRAIQRRSLSRALRATGELNFDQLHQAASSLNRPQA